MPTREVDLVIRARDEARAAFEAAVKSLEEIRSASRGASAEVDRYGTEAAQAADRVRQLNVESSEVASSISRQGEALNRATAEQRRLRQESERATAAQRTFTNQQERLDARLADQVGRLGQLRARYGELSGVLSSTTAPARMLVREFERLGTSIPRTEARIRDLQETQALIAAESDRAGRAQRRLGDQYEQQAARTDQLRQEVLGLRTTYQNLGTSIRVAERNQVRHEQVLERSVRATQRAAAAEEEAAARRTAAQARAVEAEREQVRVQAQRERAEARSRDSAAIQAANAATRAESQRREADQTTRLIGQLNRLARAQQQAARSGQQQAAATGQLNTQMGRLRNSSRGAIAAMEQFGAANRRAGASQSVLAQTFQEFFGGSRQALSFFQRLRGEVIALVAAYGGLFAAFQGVNQVLEATGTIQAAQNRIAVALGTDDIQEIGAEFDFLRRTADRLGVSFGVLLQEYSQFAVATRGTNLEGQRTRDIFLSVAEAARVQNLTLDQVQGTFLALTQIVSRGAVSMEELRRQLGDRLPGAVQIFAAALDLSVRELVDLVETGNLSSDTLVQFADELQSRFGPRLPSALETITAALGRFQNQLFQTFARIGEGGAIEGLIELFDRLSEVLAGAEFRSFADRLSTALGALARAAAAVAENFDTILIAVAAILGRRIGTLILGIARAFAAWRVQAAATVASLTAVNVAAGASAGIFARAAIAIRGLVVSVGALVASTGVGVVFAAIGAAIAAWATSTDDATDALVRHERLIDRVRNAYDEANGEVEAFRENLEGVTVAQVAQALRQTQEQLADLRRESIELTSAGFFQLFLGDIGISTGGRNPLEEQLDRFAAAFRAGSISLQEYLEILDGLQQAGQDLGPGFTDLIVNAQESAREIEALRVRIQELTDILTALTGNAEDSADAVGRLGNRGREAGNEIERQAQALRAYQEALQELASEVPALADGIERLERIRGLENQRDAAFQLADAAGVARTEVERLFQRARTALDADAIFGTVADGLVSAANLFRNTADLFGPGLAREVIRIGTLLREELGDATFNALTGRQQAVVSEIVRVYGQLPPELAAAIRDGLDSGSADGVRAVIQNFDQLANRDFLAEVFGSEDFDTGAIISQLQRVDAERQRLAAREQQRQERLAEQEARRIERQRQATLEQVRNLGFQIDQQRLINAGQERQAFIEDQIRQAKEANLQIDERSLNLVRLRAATLFDLQNQEDERELQLQRIQDAEQRVNDLLDLRSQLVQQIAVTSDRLRRDQLQDSVDALGPEIAEATDRALELAQAFEGNDIAVRTLISRLETLRQEGTQTARDIILRFDELRGAFEGSFRNAVNGFSEAIAMGESAVRSLGDAFQAFAANFLRRISEMILEQVALNAAMSVFGGSSGGGFNLTSIFGGLFGGGGGGGSAVGLPAFFRTGGVVGPTGHPARFLASNMFQTGGLVGASGSPVRLPNAGTAGFGDAFPAVLHRGEEVLSSDNPRNILNGGGGTTVVEPKIVNAVDAPGILDAAVADVRGQRVFFNFISANRNAVRSALGN